jgi:exopolysaccharide biosynthesis polyprenyl glycosylphosphotransferase
VATSSNRLPRVAEVSAITSLPTLNSLPKVPAMEMHTLTLPRRVRQAVPVQRRGHRLSHIGHMSKDVLICFMCGMAGFSSVSVPHHISNGAAVWSVLYATVTALIFQNSSWYRTSAWDRTVPKIESAVKGTFLAEGLTLLLIWGSGQPAMVGEAIALAGLLSAGALALWVWLEQRIMARHLERGDAVRNVVVVGAGTLGQAVAKHLQSHPRLGYRFCGFVDDQSYSDVVTLGHIDGLENIVRSEFVDDVFVAAPGRIALVKRAIERAQALHCNVKVIPEAFDLFQWAPFEYVGGLPVCSVHREPIPAFELALKRGIDLFVASLVSVFLLPAFATIAAAIKLDSPGPVLYRSYRIGKKGRKFVFLKFRTMVTNADALKSQYMGMNEREGPFFKLSHDPRVTRLGAWLRRYSLDELPQLWNVIMGDMSLVGPRPHPVDDFQRYSLEHRRRLDITPGISGLWQVTARTDPSFQKCMEFDLQYIENWSLWMDFTILLKTVPAVIKGSGE